MAQEYLSPESKKQSIFQDLTNKLAEYLLDGATTGLTQIQESELREIVRRKSIETTRKSFATLYKLARSVDVVTLIDELVNEIKSALEKNPLRGQFLADKGKTQRVINHLVGKTKIGSSSSIVSQLVSILDKKSVVVAEALEESVRDDTRVSATPIAHHHHEGRIADTTKEIGGDSFFETMASIGSSEELREYLQNAKNKTLLLKTGSNDLRIPIQQVITMFNSLDQIFKNDEFDKPSGKFKVWHALSPWMTMSGDQQIVGNVMANQIYPSLVGVLQK